MAKRNPLIPIKPKSTTWNNPRKSGGILDDYAQRKNIATQEGTIEKVPVNNTDIANKKYVDDQFPVTHASTTGQTTDDHHPQSHNIASHSDTTATGAELETLTNGSDADALHTHDATNILNPVGAIIMYGNATAPTGWVNCDGASLLRAGTYAALYAIIGVTYGTADGTHFNVPDMRGAFPRGAGTSTQFTQDHTTTLGTYEDDSMQGHKHATSDSTIYGWAGAVVDNNISGGTSNTSINLQTINTGVPKTDATNGTPRTANETRPNNLGVNFIIKY